jgi:predicted RNA-binding protein with TRAM domain
MGLTNGTTYTFTVVATNSEGDGPASAASNPVTPATVPGAPTIGTATAGDGEAEVAFTPPGSNGGATITLYTATSSPGGFTGTGAASPITVTGLTNGTAYTFTVIATNAKGDSAASGASNSVTPTAATTVPGAPTIGTATHGNAQASVAFTPPASDGGAAITGYTATSSPGGFTGTAASSPITVTGLTNGTAYTFTVKATNSVGDGPASGASNSVTPATVPGAPTIGTATAGNEEAEVAFTPPASNGGNAITGYTATSSPGGFTGTAASSPITVTGLTNGTAYTFTVVATNDEGDSAASGASNSVTPATVPGAPTGVSALQTGPGEVTITFSAPGDNGGSAILDYTVTSDIGGYTATENALSIVISGIASDDYVFTVTARNSVGSSTGAVSATVTVS